MKRLAGRRIIVTRAADRGTELTDLLRNEGADVEEMPMTESVDPRDGGEALRTVLAKLDEYDWLVVTSPEGARRVRRIVPDIDRRSIGIAAVGRATADEIGRADLVPSVQTGLALGEEFPKGTGRVLFPAARDAGTEFESAARAKGWTVERITAYATEPIAIEVGRMRDAIARSDAVLFASGSSARSWVHSAGCEVPRVVVAMGPSTARVLDELGVAPVVVAADQSLQGLVDALIAQFDEL